MSIDHRTRTIWKQLISQESRHVLHTVFRRSIGTISQMTNLVFGMNTAWVERIPVGEIMFHTGDPESEMVGIYLRMEDGLRGHALLMMPLPNALQLVDTMLGRPRGTTTALEALEYSALAEMGNLMVSYFLNSVFDLVQGAEMMRPSPPAVTVDMLGAILNTVVIPLAGVRDDLLVAGTTFKDISERMQIQFWIFPDQANQDLVAA